MITDQTYGFTIVSFQCRDVPVLIWILCISRDHRQLGIVTISHTIMVIDIVVLNPKSIAFCCSHSLFWSCREWSWLPVFVPVYSQGKGLESEAYGCKMFGSDTGLASHFKLSNRMIFFLIRVLWMQNVWQ